MNKLISLLLLLLVCSFGGLCQSTKNKQQLSCEAAFPGGMANLQKYLLAKIRYPEAGWETGTTGTIMARVVINEQGNPEQVSIVHIDMSPQFAGCFSESLLSTLKYLPRWEPAMYNGKPIKSVVLVPVRYQLNYVP